MLFRTIRAAFNQRRKTLVNALGNGFGELTKEQITAAVTSCGLDERVRGEALTMAQFAAVSDAIARTKKLC